MNDSADVCQALFDTGQDAVFVVDAGTGTIAAANRQALNDTGYCSEELHGISIDRLLRRQDGAPLDILSHGLSWPQCVAPHQLIGKCGDALSVSVSTSRFCWRQANCLFVIAARQAGAEARGGVPDARLPEREEFPTIVGQSVKIRDVCRRIGSLANSDVTVLILGESGTGKEVIANAVHAHSQRGRAAFVKVNCAGLTETLLESELFGHVKGAFTGAIRDRVGRFKLADRGTIFLDEIGSMSLAGQAKLLRVLQEREFEPVGSSIAIKLNVRVIAATNSDLAKAVTEGRFREDLYYRLNVFPISLPPLRERKEDIVLLAQHFLQHYARSINKKIYTLAPETLGLLAKHGWPGNVRELENAIEHAVIVESGPVIRPVSLPMNLAESRDARDGNPLAAEPRLRDKLNDLEKQILVDALIRANGIKKRAAEMLGVDARNLPYLLRKHHLDEGAGSDVSVH